MERLTVERLGHLGDGIASGPVFVRRALPGETVEGSVANGRMAVPRIVTPSTDRVAARCRHYKACGGCDLQHASDAFVANWKKDAVERTLFAVGLEQSIRTVHTSAENSRRRATLTGRRTKSGAVVGFHSAGSDTLVEVTDCRVLDPMITGAFEAFGALVCAGSTRKGQIKIAVTATDQGLDVLCTGGRDPDLGLRETLAYLALKADFARLVWNDDQIAERRRPQVSFQGIDVPIPPGAFLQATPDGEKALQNCVTEALNGDGPIVDLFSGCGTFSLPLSRSLEVHAFEGDAGLIGALDSGWRHGTGLRRVTTQVRDLFRQPLDADELSRFHGAVIDPPRAGAEAQTRELAKSDVARIVAVSCNPVTFARDAVVLVNGGYQLEWIDLIDQFRWSPHIEIAALFKKI